MLPLHNLSNDTEQEYFSYGMTDELITEISKFGKLRVISHSSVERYKERKQTSGGNRARTRGGRGG